MKKILLDVKPFQETLDADMCGPASLKIVLEYYGVNKSEEELAKMAGHKNGLGIDDRGIKNVAEKLGFKVKIKNNSNYKDIKKWLKKDARVPARMLPRNVLVASLG
ncbi:MAG: cysteine peptidase family C39 domain-containing protein [Patescibacteria group bacterium]